MDKDFLNMNKRQSPKNVKFKSKIEIKVIYVLVNWSDRKRRRGLKLSYFGGTFLEF